MPDLQLAEEFLNTVDERTFSRHGEIHDVGERLTSPDVLHAWLKAHDVAVPKALRRADLNAAIALRTGLRQALLGGPNTALADYPLQFAMDSSGALGIVARSERPWLDVIVETVARSTAQGDWKRLKLCDAPDCRWAFYDTSRNGRGRWCHMEVCGNRAKTRAYRQRQQSA